MKVILMKDVHNLGFTNDVIQVKDGYGRNYLIPQGIAALATETNLKIHNENMVGGNIYVFGGMVYWQYLPEAEMKYNFNKSQYEATLLLKQGYYNYQYVWLENGKTGDETFIEGNHFETENNYTIRVYYREPGSFMDKLIGIESIYSVK